MQRVHHGRKQTTIAADAPVARPATTIPTISKWDENDLAAVAPLIRLHGKPRDVNRLQVRLRSSFSRRKARRRNRTASRQAPSVCTVRPVFKLRTRRPYLPASHEGPQATSTLSGMSNRIAVVIFPAIHFACCSASAAGSSKTSSSWTCRIMRTAGRSAAIL